jgi:hypothetical protein
LKSTRKIDKTLMVAMLELKTAVENQKNKVVFWAKSGSDEEKKQELLKQFNYFEQRKKKHNAAVREMVEKGDLPQEEAKLYLFEGGRT